MKRWQKVGMVGAAALVVMVGAALVSLDAIARKRGVSRVPVPSGTLIAERSVNADYADAYEIEVPAGLFPDIRSVSRVAFQKGDSAGENIEEMVYSGESPGLVFRISYLLRGDSGEARVTVSTVVHYENWKGKVYFAVVRPFHRILTPFGVSYMIEHAKKASFPDRGGESP